MSINNRRNSWSRKSLDIRNFDLSRGPEVPAHVVKVTERRLRKSHSAKKRGTKKLKKKAPYSAPKIAQKLKSFFSLYLYLKDTNEA